MRLSAEEKEQIRAKKLKGRNAFENKNKGGYELIYPSAEFPPQLV